MMSHGIRALSTRSAAAIERMMAVESMKRGLTALLPVTRCNMDAMM